MTVVQLPLGQTMPVEPLRLWSVTSLLKLGMGTSEPLVNWAVRTTAEGAIDNLAVVQAMLQSGDRQGAVEHLVRIRFRRTKAAMMRGTEIHAAAEAIALGAAPPPIPEGNEPYVEQYVRWVERFRPEFVMAEAPVYNPAEGYAGTLDGIMKLDGVPVLYDIKTTEHPPGGDRSRPPYPETALQLVAYSRATEVGVISEQRYAGGKRYYLYDPSATHEPMPEVAGAFVIVLSPFDCTAIPVRIDDEVWRAFRCAIGCARFNVVTSKSLFGPQLSLRPEVPTV